MNLISQQRCTSINSHNFLFQIQKNYSGA